MRILINLMKYCYKSPYKLPVKQPVTAVDHKKWPMTIELLHMIFIHENLN